MKRLALLALALLPVCAFAQSQYYTWAAAATGALPSSLVDNRFHTLQVVGDLTPSACTIRLEGSLDNVSFFDLSGSQSCVAGPIMFHVADKAVHFVRANVLTLTGATLTITYWGSN